MILPIIAYGNPLLRTQAQPIKKADVHLHELIQNMFDTMYNAQGVGLAAPQIGQSLQLFVVDASSFSDDEQYAAERDALIQFKRVFINLEIIKETGEPWKFTEGCLSIPDIRENVSRNPEITVRYKDEHWNDHTQQFTGIIARIIQHEYDHTQGVLFTDKISALKKKIIQKKMDKISKGLIQNHYPMTL